jgi:hypothetical protein
MKNKYTYQPIPNNRIKNDFGSMVISASQNPVCNIHPIVLLRLHLDKMKETLTPDEYDRYLDALLPPSPGEQTNEN